MDILDHKMEELFDTIFADKVKGTIELHEEFNGNSYTELFSLIEENNSMEECIHIKHIETSISISTNDFLFSRKSILKIINE